MLLDAKTIRVAFGGVKALDGVDLLLRQGEILGLIGPNGAGKTTLVNVLTGFQRPTDGKVLLRDQTITNWAPARIAAAGLGRTFQNVRLFHDLSVGENVELGAVGTGARRKEARRLARELLERMRLEDKAALAAGSLPHGEEKKLAIARVLAMRPRFLLLDEPAAGLNEVETYELVAALEGIRSDFQLGLLVIEHDMRFIMNLCERIQVLDYGRTICIGTPNEVRADPGVLTAYLGTARGSHAGD